MLIDWLVDGAPGVSSSPEILARLADGLLAGGIPIDRAAVFVLTLHPNVVGRGFYWMPGQPLTTTELTLARQQTREFQESPVHTVFSTGEELRIRVSEDSSYELTAPSCSAAEDPLRRPPCPEELDARSSDSTR